MKSLVSQFTQQISHAIEIGESASLSSFDGEIANVLITGLGGSGIGGTIVSQLVADEVKVPIVVNNDYGVPNFLSNRTLVIASSFSGNTEETLHALELAEKAGCEICCITSGGKMEEIAKEKGYNHIILPEGRSPRAMLTFSLTQQFFMFRHYGLIGDEFKQSLKDAVVMLEEELEDIKTKANDVANLLHNKMPVIYADASFMGVATRMRQQINENAKMLCWHHVMPENNHNELVGWAGGSEMQAVVVLRNETDFVRTQTRMKINREIISRYTPHYVEIWSKGSTQTERALYHILFGDWVSVYLSELKNVDSIEVDVIDYLKGELAKL